MSASSLVPTQTRYLQWTLMGNPSSSKTPNCILKGETLEFMPGGDGIEREPCPEKNHQIEGVGEQSIA